MRALAAYIMRGRTQATLVAGGMAVFSLVFPLVSLLSSAAIALVTLSLGAREGLIVGGFAGLLSGLFLFASQGSPLPALGFLLALWFPVWLLSLILRYSRSLALSVQAAGFLGLLLVILVHLSFEDPTGTWTRMLEPLREHLVQGGALQETESHRVIAEVARWMTSAFGAALSIQALIALFLGRWSQALLYHPGGFGQEFRTLRLSKTLGVLAIGLLIALSLVEGSRWAAEGLLLLTPLFFLQGLSIAHYAAAAFRANWAWLAGFYMLLVFSMPQAEVLVAGVGLGDIWMDLRGKIRPRSDPKE